MLISQNTNYNELTASQVQIRQQKLLHIDVELNSTQYGLHVCFHELI
ncbi:hypothetical protein MtrunA17_Chr4g0047401 [Medicago truncatula]|uniref:Uncharacterized protein n=1 Tax=Medicago truncatula TaxID=3880 RepID=A0A396IA01_MEDTR|nr:hypothetical protein MtrunA17_Chr4g0047401 [Medicago truncatula]